MIKCKKLSSDDMCPKKYKILNFSFWDGASVEYRKFIHNNILNREFDKDFDNSEGAFREFIQDEFQGDKGSRYWFDKIQMECINKQGLFIAAPASHFNLDGVDKKTEFGYFQTEIIEVKDPVVYEYCKNNICRIVTKWGTDDDQSYLDSALLNESHN